MTTETVQKKDINQVFPEILFGVAKHKDQLRAIEEYLISNHKMIPGTFTEIVAKPERLNLVDKDELATFANAVFQVTQDENIDPSKFFTAKLVKATKKFEFKQPEVFSLPWEFDEAIQVAPDSYLTKISYQELAQAYQSGVLSYNMETQRLAKKSINKKSGNIKYTPDIKNKSVQNIKRLMLEGKYEPSTIIINVLVDGKSSVSYTGSSLTINEDSTVNIIDGAHRTMAAIEVVEESPEFEGYFNVDLKFYPLEKAQKLLAITNTVNSFDKTLVKFYGGEEYGQEIAKFLRNIPSLKDRIEIKTALTKQISITNFAILSEAIQSIFDPKDGREKYDVQMYLKDFFEYLIPSYNEQLIKNRMENLKTSWFSHHNMFVGFIAIAKVIYDKHGKEASQNLSKISDVLDGIDFNKSTSPFTEIMGGQGKVNSNRVKKDIAEFITNEAKRILK